jgi:Fe-S cluster assembly protein SufD
MSYTLETLASQTKAFPGFPTSKTERWRFSHLKQWLEVPFANASKQRRDVDFRSPYEIVIEEGALMAQSLPEGVTISYECSQGSKHLENPFNVFNSAYAPSVCIHIALSFEAPLHIVYQYGSGLHHSRVSIALDAGAEGAVIERFVGGGSSFITHHSHIYLDAGSKLVHTLIQDLDSSAAMVGESALTLEESSALSQFCLLKGAAFHQHFYHTVLKHQSAVAMNALLLGRNKQRLVLCTDLNHRERESKSFQRSRQILYDESVAVFDGKALIEHDAQGSEAIQGAHTLLLSDTAQIHAKPHLEIYTDDLQASHGATVGQLDEEAMAYLQSRGIPEERAKRMMIDAFAADTLESIEDDGLRKHIETLIGGHHDEQSL